MLSNDCETDVDVTHLKVVVQRNDVFVTFGDLFQDMDLIPDLVDREHRRGDTRGKVRRTICSRPSMSFLLITLQA